MSKLNHPAGNILVFKRKAKTPETCILRKFEGSNHHFPKNLRLKGAMFNHHMPWGYNGLFEGHGIVPKDVTIEEFNDIMQVKKSNDGTEMTIYPSLQDL